MNILNLVGGNAIAGPQSLRFPARPKPAVRFRGNVVIDPAVCLACGICEYVCVSRAIELTPAEDHCEWSYDPASCTYCGRCVDHCPAAALSQTPDRGVCHGQSGELRENVTVVYPSCPECGKPTMPVNDVLLGRAFKELTPELGSRARLCERCRHKATVHSLKRGFGATSDTERNTDGR